MRQPPFRIDNREKNARKQRDPEAHQAKKGQNWHFGFKAHVGVDAVAGTVHTLEVTAANAHNLTRATLARWHMAKRKKSVPEEERPQESMLASVRSRVEHVFHALKDLVGLRAEPRVPALRARGGPQGGRRGRVGGRPLHGPIRAGHDKPPRRPLPGWFFGADAGGASGGYLFIVF